MNLALSDEETLVAETTGKIGLSLATGDASPVEAWSMLEESGLLDLRAAAGSQRLTATAARLVVENLAQQVCPAPYLGHLLGVELLQLASDHPLAEVVPSRAGGPLAIGFDASLENVGRSGTPIIAPDASPKGLVVAMADDCPTIFAASQSDQQGIDIGRTRVDAGAIVYRGGAVSDTNLERWHAFALSMVAADLVGVMKGALSTAIGFVNERRQFGRPIASFQAVQHILADQKVACAGAAAATAYAAWAVDELDPREAVVAARVAKAKSSEAGRSVTEAVIQVHGGMGMTWECGAHRYLRRAALDRRLLGDELHHYALISQSRQQLRNWEL